MADSELFTTLVSSAFDAGIVPARKPLQPILTNKTLRSPPPTEYVFDIRAMSFSGDDVESLAAQTKEEIAQNLVRHDGTNGGKRLP